MSIAFNLKLKMASAGLAVALVSGGCAMMAPKAERYVAPPLGSTWVQARRDSGSFGSSNVQVSSRRGERMWQGQQVITFESPGSAILAASDSGNWLGLVSGDKPLVTWEPGMSWDWPLEVGKTWTHNHRMTIHARNQTIPYQVTQKVEAYEDVTVPAGTFKAFKISYSDKVGNEVVQWNIPELGLVGKRIERRTAKNPNGPGMRETELISQNIKK